MTLLKSETRIVRDPLSASTLAFLSSTQRLSSPSSSTGEFWKNGSCSTFSEISGKSVMKRVNVGMNELVTSVRMPNRMKSSKRRASPQATPRGTFRSIRSTSGVSRSCSSMEMKMMNASCGRNQNVERTSVNVMPSRMDVR